MRTVYTQAYHRVRMATMCRDHWRCQWPGCGRRKKLTTHHIVTLRHGGKDEETNLITLCRKCHDRLHIQMDKARRTRAKKKEQVAILLRLKSLFIK